MINWRKTVLQTRSKKNDFISTFVPTVNEAKKKTSPKEESKKKESKKLVEFGDFRVFVVGDIVWTKLKGWQSWPSKASQLLSYSRCTVNGLQLIFLSIFFRSRK